MASGDMEVKRNSTGALANISSADRTRSANDKVFSDQRTQRKPSSSSLAHDADAKELVVEKGALPVVFDLLRSDNETVQMMAYRVITNLGDNGSLDASPSSSPSSSAQCVQLSRMTKTYVLTCRACPRKQPGGDRQGRWTQAARRLCAQERGRIDHGRGAQRPLRSGREQYASFPWLEPAFALM